jgi:ATP-dependent Zn protease
MKRKNLPDTAHKNLKESKSFFSKISTLVLQPMGDGLQKHRLSLRKKLQLQPLNIITFVSLFPFFVGFSHFVQQKYPFQKTYLFFEKNLPGMSVPTEKIHWDTFQYIWKNNKFFQSVENDVYWSERHILIQNAAKNRGPGTTDFNLIASIVDQAEYGPEETGRSQRPSWQNVTGQYPVRKDGGMLGTRHGIPPVRYNFTLRQHGIPKNTTSAFRTYYSQLDEMPSKLQSQYSKTPFQQESEIFTSPSTGSVEPSWANATDQFGGAGDFLGTSLGSGTSAELSDFLYGTQQRLLETVPELGSFLAVHTPLQSSISNDVLKTVSHTHNFKNWQALEAEIRKLFSTNGLLLNFTDYESLALTTTPRSARQSSSGAEQPFPTLLGHSSKFDDLKAVQDVLFDIDAIFLPQEARFTRLMSGYTYPDMNIDDVRWFRIHQIFSGFGDIKILLPPSYSVVIPVQTQTVQPPDFQIYAKPLLLKNPSDQEILYNGPGIVLNSNSGLDWEIASNKNGARLGDGHGILTSDTKPTFRAWLEKYLRADNPFSDSFQNFFGQFDSPEFLASGEVSQNVTQEKWFQTLPIFRNGIIAHTSSSQIPFDSSFQLPYISPQEWQTYSERRVQNGSGGATQFSEVTLPIIETRVPASNALKFNFALNSFVDYSFSSPMPKAPRLRREMPSSTNQATQQHVRSNFTPAISSFLNEESFGTQLSSGVYQKTTSVFDNDSDILFYDLWEPLTFRSWLVISQVGFAFLVFRILKALADNYGRELLVYLLDLVALLGVLDEDLKQEIEILMGQREKGFRIISKTTKTFSDIAGIQKLLPEIVEIVWFLRNSGKEFSISKTLPRGVLLTGPPGTGKTLLVQALAGEAEVPVLALSGSSLLEPGESGALKLEILFQEARRLAPCIVFIDEMDTLAQKREQVLQNPMGADEVIESLHEITRQGTQERSSFTGSTPSSDTNSSDASETLQSQQDMQREKLRILMQFLVELDGVQGRDGVVVIGATNRPEMLDPAIVRPGRFDRVLELGLPGPEKRQDILKLYSQNLGVVQNISWNYLTHRTAGYSAADLASIMNQSSLRAIMIESSHTIETIEHGIDRITTIGFETPPQRSKNTLPTLRLAYYQAGKVLLSTLLEHHPPTLVTHLWPRRTNVRALQITANLQKYFFQFACRIELEHRIIGCYAGKAAEILLLEHSSSESNLSDLGIEDIQFAQNLIQWMTQKWYLYSKTLVIQTATGLPDTKNSKEYRDAPEKISFFDQLLRNVESPYPDQKLGPAGGTAADIQGAFDQQSQSYFPLTSWQSQISDEFEIATRSFSDWYRLYLPDPQETERNLEWSPPDDFYHGNSLLDQLTEFTNWNDLSEISAGYQMHSLVLQSFNRALKLLDQHREILDALAFELMHREILRESEIAAIFKQFGINTALTSKILNPEHGAKMQEADLASVKDLASQDGIRLMLQKPVVQSWGENSRRENQRWVNMDFTQSDLL